MNWKEIPSCGSRYHISENGHIKKWNGGSMGIHKSAIGYMYAKLTTTQGRKTKLIHRLVAEAFIPNPENKPTVNHLDGNKENNQKSNLEWATRSEQAQHAWDTGLHKMNANRKRALDEGRKKRHDSYKTS